MHWFLHDFIILVEWVDCFSQVVVDLWDSNLQVWTLFESNRWLQNRYLSLPIHVLGIISIGQGLVLLNMRILWLGENIMSGSWRLGFHVWQHYKVTMSVYCDKSTPSWHYLKCLKDVNLKIAKTTNRVIMYYFGGRLFKRMFMGRLFNYLMARNYI